MPKNLHALMLIVLLFFSACTSAPQNPLRISATTWIGYTPLFYAKEKGWLDAIDVKLINVVSLSENMYLYKAGNSDAYTGTQYEHSVLKDSIPTLIPIMLFDRSYGGDIIMSNASLQGLKDSNATIDAYLEMDSINLTMLHDFIEHYQIDEKRINYINRDQVEISSLHSSKMPRNTLIVTYVPFDSNLKQNGFQEIISTKNGMDLLVVDALFTTKKNFLAHREQYIQLKQYVDDAILALDKDPKAFFEIVRPYMDGLRYEEFMASLHDIIWINKERSDELQERMRKAAFPTKDLI